MSGASTTALLCEENPDESRGFFALRTQSVRKDKKAAGAWGPSATTLGIARRALRARRSSDATCGVAFSVYFDINVFYSRIFFAEFLLDLIDFFAHKTRYTVRIIGHESLKFLHIVMNFFVHRAER